MDLSPEDQLKVIAVSAPAIVPLIKNRQGVALNLLIGAYRQGKEDLRPEMAAYCAVTDLLNDIQTQLNNFNRLTKG